MAAKEYPVTAEQIDALADEALGPDPALDPLEDIPSDAPGQSRKPLQAEHARRQRLLAGAPGVRDALSDRRKRTFLQALARTGNVAASSAFAGWGKGIAASLRKSDKEFAQSWDWALQAYVAELELEAKRRAVDGVERGVYHKGELVGTELHYSDSLLQTLLKANDRAKYGDKAELDVTQKGGVLVVPAKPGSVADWEQAARADQSKFRDGGEEQD